MKVIKGKLERAQRVVAYGPEGIGKSTFAAAFPNPVFIDTEGSTAQMDVVRTPKPSSWTAFKQQLAEVKDSDFKTLVIDTVDWAESMMIADICAQADKMGIEDFGFGKGYVYVAEEAGRFLDTLNEIRDAGKNVVLVAHAQMRKFEQPDEMGAYDRWELKLSRKSAPLYKEWADMVLFANYKTIVVDVDGKKKAQGGSRVMYTAHHPCWDAKNRHNLEAELPFEFKAVARCFPVIGKEVEAKGAKEGATRMSPVQEAEKPVEKVEPVTRIAKEDPLAFCPALYELVEKAGVTYEEIQKVVAMRGYYPENTPVENYEERFVNGVLVAAWPQVMAMIEENRKAG